MSKKNKKKIMECPYCHKLIDCTETEVTSESQEVEDEDIIVLSDGRLTMDDWEIGRW